MSQKCNSIVERADERAQEKAKQIILRYILDRIREVGIPDKMLDYDAYHFESSLNHPWYQENLGIDAMEAFLWVWNNAGVWARNGSIVLIDGGSSDTRKEMALALLSRAIKVNAYISTPIGKCFHYLEVLAIWNSFNEERFHLRSEMIEIPVLLFEEIDVDIRPRENSDASLFLDSVLIGRAKHCPATILTVSEKSEKIKQKSTVLGRTFERVLRTRHSPEDKIIKIRLEDKSE